MHVTTGAHGDLAVGKAISLDYNDLPSEACVALVTKTVQRFRAIQVVYGGKHIDVLKSSYDIGNIVSTCNQSKTGIVRFLLD